MAVNGYPDGYEGWTSPHRWLPPMDNVDRARGKAWPSIPSQPILSAGVITTEHAKKHELVRGLVAERKTETELTNDARLKKPAIRQIEIDLLTQPAFRAD